MLDSGIWGMQRGDELLSLLRVAATLGALTLVGVHAGPTLAQAPNIGPIAANLVSIEAHFDNCGQLHDDRAIDQDKTSSGFGLVVGEDATTLYIATRAHVVAQRLASTFGAPAGDNCVAAEIVVQLYTESVPAAERIAEVADSPWLNLGNDLGFLRIPKPKTWLNGHPHAATPEQIVANSSINLIGHDGQSIGPGGAGLVVNPCDTQQTVEACSVVARGIESGKGDSGAVLFGAAAEIVGLLQGAEAGGRVAALRIDEVRKLATNAGIPWNVFSAEEAAAIGADLNAAIGAGDEARVEAVASQFIDLDRKYAVKDEPDYTPSEHAAFTGQFDMIETLIEYGARDLRRAARASLAEKHPEVVERMLVRGLDMSCLVGAAAVRGYLDLAIDIVGSPNFNVSTCPPAVLYDTIRGGAVETAIRLIQAGVPLERGTLWHDGSSLTLAILMEQQSLVNALLEGGADVTTLSMYPGAGSGLSYGPLSSQDVVGPLHAAAFVGDALLLKRLIDLGGNPDVHEASSGTSTITEAESPFESAVLGGQVETMKVLAEDYSVSPFGHRVGGYDDMLQQLRTSNLPPRTRFEVEELLNVLIVDFCRRPPEAFATTCRDW